MKKLSCHCGKVEAEINISNNFEKILRCNCSICKRKGAVMSMVKNEDFKIVKGKDVLSLYQFHSKGSKTLFLFFLWNLHSPPPRSNPAMTGFNIGCIDDINIFAIENINVLDGQNHPLDKK